MSEPKPQWNKDQPSEPKPEYTAAETWREFYKGNTGREPLTEPQPVYCCDAMREAVDKEMVCLPPDYDYAFISNAETLETAAIKFCPFCGAAVGGDKQRLQELAAKLDEYEEAWIRRDESLEVDIEWIKGARHVLEMITSGQKDS